MFELARRLLGRQPTGGDLPDETISQLNSENPLADSAKGIPASESSLINNFVCRELMLSRDERIEGYVFSLSRKLQTRMQGKSEQIQHSYDHGLLLNLAPMFASPVLGRSMVFIHLNPSSLNTPLLEAFSNKNVVIMVTPGMPELVDWAGIRTTLQRLKEIGIKHGWTLDRLYPEHAEIMAEADYIEIETANFDGVQLKALSHKFRAIRGVYKLIASGLETSDDFNLCFQCGFDFFTGPFASNRKNWHPEKSDINRIRVFEILNMVRAGEEFDAIASRLRTEPILTFKLLRYLNSPGVGLQKSIIDISQALLFLGRESFHRWLSLMLFDFKRLGYRERVLCEQVLVRARFMELLAGQGDVPVEADQLFMTGLFSMLDVIMNQPLTEVLEQVSLPEAVAAALKGKPSLLHEALKLVIAIELGNTEEMIAAATHCGLNSKVVSGSMIEALTWAELLMRDIR